MFRRTFLIAFAALLLLFMVSVALAQDSGEFDWSEVGVNVGVIGAIIALVQIFKKYIPGKFIVFVPVVLSVAAFFVVGGEQPIINVLYWAAAAGYLWKIANGITPESWFKSKADLDAG